ncbi:MAG: hypothetical protein LBH22_02875, partial [Bacteroidales bacterium]|nr:hypothetical protein [Bacteroidales bacterium]
NFTGSVMNQGTLAYYWSQTAPNNNQGTVLWLAPPSSVNPQFNLQRNSGATLRCVQDLQIF